MRAIQVGIFAALLALPWAAPLSVSAASEESAIEATTSSGQQSGQMRFRGMDRNNDGIITRDEWRGSTRSFTVHDWNGDGVLSGDEVRPGGRRSGRLDEWDFEPPTASRFGYWDEAAFTNLDHNRDGRIQRREWHYDMESFRRVDRNNDGVLSRTEFLTTDLDDDREDNFDNLDMNGNGRVERSEWHASAEAFDRLDRNRDSVITRAEAIDTAGTPADAADQFASIDFNGDGRISADEWHWSRGSFDARDLNRDGMLTRRELYAASGGAVGTSGQSVRVDPGQRWTDTGLFVRAGDTITISAEGSIVMSTTDPNDIATPAGSRSGRRAAQAPLPQEPAGALIAQIGDSGPMLIGTSRTVRAPVSGRLYLGVNDDHLPDNSGHFQVTVNVQTP